MAFDSIEARIVLAARDSLQQIDPGRGYLTRPRVELGFRAPDPVTSETLMVYEASGGSAEILTHHPMSWEHRVRFRVHGLTAPAGGTEGRQRALLNMMSDVRRRLLRQDRTLDGLVPMGLLEADPDDTDEATGGNRGEGVMDFVARVTTDEEE